jgi:hypothetical protein
VWLGLALALGLGLGLGLARLGAAAAAGQGQDLDQEFSSLKRLRTLLLSSDQCNKSGSICSAQHLTLNLALHHLRWQFMESFFQLFLEKQLMMVTTGWSLHTCQ